ncbi:hypothetical protein [Allorhodopirellula heiligendammensis]|uniref:Uncharacterized protein n=1 Tax=Allorhodopirellula heiligendammensis TaxID=2714739 RepID=A0A5C6C7S9_9BACT|nr:hypothetical protein [Allorhodopirellula heiligendammensis]TWU19551.1 hypothetical protein Poly21_17250 [Allorhodopirellula heiligendammensis]
MIEDIKKIAEYQSLTAQEIAEALNATPKTRHAIDLGDLLFLLNNRGMLVRLIRPQDTGEKWSGTVVNMIVYVSENAPAMAAPVNQWFSHITNDRNNLFDTTLPEYGSQLKSLALQFGGQPEMPSADDFEAIAALGGGWRYGDVTAADVADAIEVEAATRRKSARVAALNDAIDAVRTNNDLADGSITLADVQAQINDALSESWSV